MYIIGTYILIFIRLDAVTSITIKDRRLCRFNLIYIYIAVSFPFKFSVSIRIFSEVTHKCTHLHRLFDL